MSEPEIMRRTPDSKAGRHAIIEQILSTQAITSQSELREALQERGISAAQATLSRDLLEIRATKVRDADGRQVYAISKHEEISGSDTPTAAQLQKWASDLLVGGATAGNLIVLRTPAGAANLLGSALDYARHEPVLGLVAGDDTIIVVCTSAQAASEYCEQLLDWAEGKTQTEGK
ncbi:arginine repressor [Gleimia hominis]|uniref:arginine repressor n=1 Tax=Gleimia hominis TaxID=595468 RepID=UPI000C809098|nr:ArgR family transcriptional regulator [Gleimia hominis]WIK65278.1 ArgR family transcriptional regulator [Gleimia hominis]